MKSELKICQNSSYDEIGIEVINGLHYQQTSRYTISKLRSKKIQFFASLITDKYSYIGDKCLI